MWKNRLIRAGGALLALLLVSVLVIRSSDAVFSGTTSNSGDSWAAGSVTLSDDDSNTAMFNTTGMLPGDTVTHCITVTYNGSANPRAVKLYSAGITDGGLGQYLNLTVAEGSSGGGSYASCTGFNLLNTIYTGTVANFATTSTNYTNGVGVFDPSATGQARVYRFTVTLDAATPNTAQLASAQAGFTWETQSS